jgi:hypothetical protein
MNRERTQAYGRVMRTLADVGPTKLHGSEQDRIREAADTLIFAAAPEEAAAALADLDALCEHLVASDRWTAERAADLLRDLTHCGPGSSSASHPDPVPTTRPDIHVRS